jgi:hypothetical protein
MTDDLVCGLERLTIFNTHFLVAIRPLTIDD